MKLNSTTQNPIKNDPSFGLHKRIKNEKGYDAIEFYTQYDDTKYDGYLEVLDYKGKDKELKNDLIEKLKKTGNYEINDDGYIKLKDHGITISKQGSKDLAYRFVLINKKTKKEEKYMVDTGSLVYKDGKHPELDDQANPKYDPKDLYTISLANAGEVKIEGPMIHYFPDSNKPWLYRGSNGKIESISDTSASFIKFQTAIRNHANIYGGGLLGMIDDLDKSFGIEDGKAKVGPLENYGAIISTPVIGDDPVSSNGYWSSNPYRITGRMGTKEDFEELIIKTFRNGKTYIADGAFTSQDINGLYLSDVLKNGDDSWTKNMFKGTVLGQPLSLGFLPENSNKEAQSHVGFKIVNSEKLYEFKNNKIVAIGKNDHYDKRKPTYVQVFDDRLASEAQQKDAQKLIEKYEKTNVDQKTPHKSALDIKMHNETVSPRFFEFDNKGLEEKIKKLNNGSEKTETRYQVVKNLLQGGNNYVAAEKSNSGGGVNWAGNTDLFKMNFKLNQADREIIGGDQKALAEKEIGTCFARENVIQTCDYWTQNMSNALNLYIAQQLGKEGELQKRYDNAQELMAPKDKIPKEKIKTIIENIELNQYKSPILSNLDTDITPQILDFPLESLGFGQDLSVSLASPYFVRRPYDEGEITKSRHQRSLEKPSFALSNSSNDSRREVFNKYNSVYNDVYNNVYDKKLKTFVLKVLTDVQDDEHKIFEDDKKTFTPYGKYIANAFTNEILKYAFVKTFAPDAIDKKSDILKYDESIIKNTTLHSFGMDKESPKNLAILLKDKLESQLPSEADPKLVKAIQNKIQNTDEKSFRLAEAIKLETGAGMNWRFDATKDFADMDSVLNKRDDFESTWDSLKLFSSQIVSKVRKTNPSSFMVAEITDVWGYVDNKGEIVKKHTDDFINETGFTTHSNYEKLFHNQFAPFIGISDEDGQYHPRYSGEFPKNMYNFMSTNPYMSVLKSHIFGDNHDKPRLAHGFILDMEVYNSHFNDGPYGREKVGEWLQLTPEETKELNFKNMDPHGVAYAKALIERLQRDSDEGGKYKEIPYLDLKKAILDLVQGEYLGNHYGLQGSHYFGDLPFETATIKMVIEQYKNNNPTVNLDQKKFDQLEHDIYKSLTKGRLGPLLDACAYARFSIGLPTFFYGTDYAVSGAEAKNMNTILGNRNIVNDKIKIANSDFNKAFNDFMGIGRSLSSKELSALDNYDAKVVKQNSTKSLVKEQYGIFKEIINEVDKINEKTIKNIIEYNKKADLSGSIPISKELLKVYEDTKSKISKEQLAENIKEVCKKQYGYEGNVKELSSGAFKELDDSFAMYKYNELGSQVICLFGTNGSTYDKIYLDEQGHEQSSRGLNGGLTVGTEFKIANPVGENAQKAVFVVGTDEDGRYFLKNNKGGGNIEIPEKDPDNEFARRPVLIFYKPIQDLQYRITAGQYQELKSFTPELAI